MKFTENGLKITENELRVHLVLILAFSMLASAITFALAREMRPLPPLPPRDPVCRCECGR